MLHCRESVVTANMHSTTSALHTSVCPINLLVGRLCRVSRVYPGMPGYVGLCRGMPGLRWSELFHPKLLPLFSCMPQYSNWSIPLVSPQVATFFVHAILPFFPCSIIQQFYNFCQLPSVSVKFSADFYAWIGSGKSHLIFSLISHLLRWHMSSGLVWDLAQALSDSA